MLRNTGVTEPVIVEYGFIDNDKDRKFVEDKYKELGEAVIKAVLEYKGLPYVPKKELVTNTYIVKKGDTLYSIAKDLNTTVDELKKANNLTSNMISIGQKLIVPNELETIYMVKPGDNLYQIARKFNTTVDKLIALNNLKNTTLSVGQILIVREVS